MVDIAMERQEPSYSLPMEDEGEGITSTRGTRVSRVVERSQARPWILSKSTKRKWEKVSWVLYIFGPRGSTSTLVVPHHRKRLVQTLSTIFTIDVEQRPECRPIYRPRHLAPPTRLDKPKRSRPCNLKAPQTIDINGEDPEVGQEGTWLQHPRRGRGRAVEIGGAGALPVQGRVEFEGTA